MKKFIALAIAVLMLATLAVPAFAVESADGSNQTANTTVQYTVGEKFTVTIPASIDLPDGANKTVAITVEELNMIDGSTFSVTCAESVNLTDTAEGDAVIVVNLTDDALVWTENVVPEGAEEADTAVANNLTVAWATGAAPTVAGTYTGQVTFTAAIAHPVQGE